MAVSNDRAECSALRVWTAFTHLACHRHCHPGRDPSFIIRKYNHIQRPVADFHSLYLCLRGESLESERPFRNVSPTSTPPTDVTCGSLPDLAAGSHRRIRSLQPKSQVNIGSDPAILVFYSAAVDAPVVSVLFFWFTSAAACCLPVLSTVNPPWVLLRRRRRAVVFCNTHGPGLVFEARVSRLVVQAGGSE